MSEIRNDPAYEKIGKTISMVFIAALFALFLYAYIPHFLFGQG